MWLASVGSGLLKYDRANRTLIRYKRYPEDSESLASNQLLSLYEDREGEVWVCMHDAKPNFFTEKPPAFESYMKQRGTLGGFLVTSIFEDSDRILWMARQEHSIVSISKPGRTMWWLDLLSKTMFYQSSKTARAACWVALITRACKGWTAKRDSSRPICATGKAIQPV